MLESKVKELQSTVTTLLLDLNAKQSQINALQTQLDRASHRIAILEMQVRASGKPPLTDTPQMTDAAERRRALDQQLDIHRANLNTLELSKAQYGIRVPVEIVNQITLEKAEIERIQQELAALG